MVFPKCLHKAWPFHNSRQPIKACLSVLIKHWEPQVSRAPSHDSRRSSATPAGRGVACRALAAGARPQVPPPEVSPVCRWSPLDCPLGALLQELPEADGEHRKGENRVIQKLGEVRMFMLAGDSSLSFHPPTHPPSPVCSHTPRVSAQLPCSLKEGGKWQGGRGGEGFPQQVG